MNATLRRHGGGEAPVDDARIAQALRETFHTWDEPEVVEHLPPNAGPDVLRDIARVLAPGGRLVLTTPNLASSTNRELLARGHSPQQSPARTIDGTFGHLRLYTMAELVGLVENAGLRVRRQEFFDQVGVGISPVRRALSAVLAPARWLRPTLRDTCAAVAERAGRP